MLSKRSVFTAVRGIPEACGDHFDLPRKGTRVIDAVTSRQDTPSGDESTCSSSDIAHADTNKHFFGNLVETRRLISLFGFYEVRYWFVETDDKNSFCLLTIGHCERDPVFVFDAKPIQDISDERRRFTLSTDEIARINPNTKTAPVFRSHADAELTAKIYARMPVLIDETKGKDGNPWNVEFRQGLFNVTSDSGLFRTADQLRKEGFVRDGSDWTTSNGAAPRQRALALAGGRDEDCLPLVAGAPDRNSERYVPLYEAKMIHQFDHRWSTYDNGDSRDAVLSEKTDSGFEPTPRYWVPEREVVDRLATSGWTRGWLMVWRDIARNSDVRTVIAAAFPRVGVNHKTPLFFTEQRPNMTSALLANWLTLPFDFVARQKIGGTSLTYFYLKQFPVLPPSSYTAADLTFIVPRVLELTYTSHSMAPFGRDLGYDGPPFAWDEDRRAILRAELDAWYAHAYGLTRDELRYILDPADVKGADYPSETFRVLKTNELRRFGEYRTAKLVLQAWDREQEGVRN